MKKSLKSIAKSMKNELDGMNLFAHVGLFSQKGYKSSQPVRSAMLLPAIQSLMSVAWNYRSPVVDRLLGIRAGRGSASVSRRFRNERIISKIQKSVLELTDAGVSFCLVVSVDGGESQLITSPGMAPVHAMDRLADYLADELRGEAGALMRRSSRPRKCSDTFGGR